MGLLRNIYSQDLVSIYHKTPVDWIESLNIATKKMIDKGIITGAYVDEIIQNVKEHGPYIVLVPGVAMPHASAESKGVLGTAIGFAKFPDKVSFDTQDADKDAQLFFTLAAKNYDQHLQNISNLSDLLMTDGVIDALEHVQSLKDYEIVMNKFDPIN